MVNFTMLVRNRPRLTKQALDSLEDGTGMNISIINDRSEARTNSVLRNFDTEFRGAHIVFLDEPRGTGALRNLAVEESERAFGREDYLYLSDNDVFFTPGWLETLVACYEESRKYGFKIVGGYNHPYNQPIPNRQWVKVGEHEVYPVHALATQSMMMDWETWDRFGPFCQTPVDRVCMSEDVELSNRITQAGFQIGVVSPALVVSTGITNTFGEKIPGWELVKSQCPKGVLCE